MSNIGLKASLLLVYVCSCMPFHLPPNWYKAGSDPEKYLMDVDSSIKHNSNLVISLKSIEKNIKGFGTIMQFFSAEKYLGKRVKMSGYLKSENVENWAGFWFRVDGKDPKSMLAFDNMMDRPIKGNTDWQKYEIVLDVPKEASNIALGALLTGTGQIWFDEKITLVPVGANVPITGKPITPLTKYPALKNVTQQYLDSTRTEGENFAQLNATYLTLLYQFDSINNVEWIYDEVKVPKGEAPLYTYPCALGGDGFYSGIQVNSKTERRIIFSVWDNQDGDNNQNAVSNSNRASLIIAGKDIVYNRFGNEGSGVHTHRVYDWTEDTTYKFLAHIVPDSTNKKTTYTLFVNLKGQWELIAKIQTPEYKGYPKSAYSFLEDFNGSDDQHRRSASFQNVWVRTTDQNWKEITEARYYLPFGDKERKIKDYGCGLSPENGFMLSSGGGFTGTYISTPSIVKRPANNKIPVAKLPE